MPMILEQLNAATMAMDEKLIAKDVTNALKINPTINDNKMPIMPTVKHTNTASIKNCCKISLERAPTEIGRASCRERV